MIKYSLYLKVINFSFMKTYLHTSFIFRIITILFCFGLSKNHHAQTILSPGDIAFTSFQSTNPDQFSFVILTDIQSGTEINFTDKGWQSSGSLRSREGIYTWTAITNYTCGDEINISSVSGMSLADDGDQILAYQGTSTSPNFVAAINFNDSKWSDATSAQTSALPPGLTEGVTAVAVGDRGNGYYNITTTTGGQNTILSQINDRNNWTTSDSPQTFTPGTYSCTNTTTTYIYDGTSWTPNDPSGVSTLDDDISVTSGTTSITSNTQANNITIDTGATLNILTNIQVMGDITINGDLIFVSTSETQTGTLGPLQPSSTISGVATVERFIPAKRAFRFLSSSVNTTNSIKTNWQERVNNTTTIPANNLNPHSGYGTHITGSTTGANGFDATISGNPSMFTFNNSTQSWGAIANTENNTLQSGIPYRVMIRGDRGINVNDNAATPTNTRLRMKGSLVSPATNVEFLNLNTTNTAFNFLGNPFQSTVDMVSVLAASTGVSNNQYYVWDPNINARGAYVTVDLPSGTNSTSGVSAANQYLQPNQAFFVTSDGDPSPSVVFSQSHKSSNNLTEVFRNQNNQEDLTLSVQLYSNENTSPLYVDGFVTKFNSTYSNTINNQDSRKLGNLDENIALLNGSDYLSIEKRNLPTRGETLQFFSNSYRSTDYTFKINLSEFENVEAYLVDNFLQQETILNTGENNISFLIDETLNASISSDRFSIIFKEKTLTVSNEESIFSVYPNPIKDDYLNIASSQLKGNEVNIKITSMFGQILFKENMTFSGSTLTLHNIYSLSSGVYILSLEKDGKVYTKKIIKE